MNRDMVLRVFMYFLVIVFFILSVTFMEDWVITAQSVCLSAFNASCVIILASMVGKVKLKEFYREMGIISFLILIPPAGIVGVSMICFCKFIDRDRR